MRQAFAGLRRYWPMVQLALLVAIAIAAAAAGGAPEIFNP